MLLFPLFSSVVLLFLQYKMIPKKGSKSTTTSQMYLN